MKGECFIASKSYSAIFPVFEDSTESMKNYGISSCLHLFSVSQLKHKCGNTWCLFIFTTEEQNYFHLAHQECWDNDLTCFALPNSYLGKVNVTRE